MNPANTQMIHAFICAIVTTHLLNYTKTHTDTEAIAEIGRLSKDPDDIIPNIDAFIADQCTSEESIESFRQAFPGTDLSPADVARQVFSLINKFDQSSLRMMKRLAIITEVNNDRLASAILAATIDAEINSIDKQAAVLN